MADRRSANENDDKPSSSDQSNYQFTFNVPSTTSGKSSFIEPDPDAGHFMHDGSESLSDSVQNYPEEFGRTYHAYRAGSYAFPNDIPEQERLALQNEALVKIFGGRLFFSPLMQKPPRTILDIATGMGEWAIQMGDTFPEAHVVATDLSPIQPAEVPPNVEFYVEDSSEPWEYSHNFDYIHTRVTAACWSSFQTQIVEQAFEYLEPGGHLECQEIGSKFACDDGSLPMDGALMRWVRDMTEAASICQRPIHEVDQLKRYFEEAGFVDVHEKIYKMPTNPWPREEHLKELGRMWERNFSSGLSGFSVQLFNRAFERTPAEIEVSLIDVRRQLSDPRIHAYLPIHVIWGRKPYPGER